MGQPGLDGGEPGDALVSLEIMPVEKGRPNQTQASDELPKDEREAVGLVKLAANQGHAKAQWALGTCYADGLRGLPKDEREAARLFKLAADQGYADAQFMLGVFNAEGCGGLRQDEREAARLWKLAADHGHGRAQCNLGEFLKQGRGGSAARRTRGGAPLEARRG